MGILTQAQIESISTRKDRTIKIVLGTQELSGVKAAELLSLSNNLANVYISPNQITSEITKEIDKASLNDLDNIKSPSQRLRSVLYLNYKQNSENFDTFDLYYLSKMEKLINHFKDKLND